MPAPLHPCLVGLCAWLAVPALAGDASVPQTRQEHIHQQGHRVMPFVLGRTLHVFRMTETGSSMRVVLRDAGAKDQLPLIQRHLLHMTARFSSGDFSVPASLHGEQMPGLKELEAGASRMKIAYAPLPKAAKSASKPATSRWSPRSTAGSAPSCPSMGRMRWWSEGASQRTSGGAVAPIPGRAEDADACRVSAGLWRPLGSCREPPRRRAR
ncbi:hypothetical protein [Azotobacter chroococcum]|nr:hypothetical protein [Azotobacter chroococcum]